MKELLLEFDKAKRMLEDEVKQRHVAIFKSNKEKEGNRKNIDILKKNIKHIEGKMKKGVVC